MAEVKNNQSIYDTSATLLARLKKLASFEHIDWTSKPGLDPDIWRTISKAVKEIASLWKDDLNVQLWLKGVLKSNNWAAKQAAVIALSNHWKHDPDILSILIDLASPENPGNLSGRREAMRALARNWRDDPRTLPIVKNCIFDADQYLRKAAVEELVRNWKGKDDVYELLADRATNDPSEEPDIDYHPAELRYRFNVRFLALEMIIEHYPTHPKTIALLHDRAINDPDEQLREWAQQQLEKMEGGRQ